MEKTYAMNRRDRQIANRAFRNNVPGAPCVHGDPIPGARTFATVQRKLRSQGRRAARKRQEELARQQQERKGALYAQSA